MAMKILVADDHPLVIDGVRTVLERLDPDADITTAQSYPQLAERLAADQDFGLIILDLNMPGGGGLKGMRNVQGLAPLVPVVVLSATEDWPTVRKAMAAGAAGYILKSLGSDALLDALQTILPGDTYLPAKFEAMPNEPLPVDDALDLGAFDAAGDVGRAALNHLPIGVFVVDRQGGVLFMNRVGGELVADSDGLQVTPTGLLKAAEVDESRRLQELIKACSGEAPAHDEALSLSRPSMSRPLSVIVSPAGAGPATPEGPAAILFVSDPERDIALPSARLSQFYGLTESEARLVQALVAGKRLETVASDFDVSMNTVRSHLKGAFRKTGTNRQSELVKLVLSGPALMNAEN